MTVHLEIPDDIVKYLVPDGQDPARAILEDAVAEAYRQRRLTMHLVGRLLNLWDPGEVDVFLGKREIYDDYTIEDVNSDLEVSKAAEVRHQKQTAA